MRKLGRVGFVAMVVLLTVSSFAQVDPFFELDYNYYSDGTFATWVGEEDNACDGNVYYSGTTSNFRTRDRIRCLDGINVSHSCWEFSNGSWTPVTCP
ncbi:MAG TPA: hypothetical protein VN380_04490 [Thermoanaerobaculia bacterium]|jgi:hypothetical protein|nr:hypothetical protein [Thermoanaerobaculia bacterium]